MGKPSAWRKNDEREALRRTTRRRRNLAKQQAKKVQAKPERKTNSTPSVHVLDREINLEDGRFAYCVDEKIFDCKFDSNSCVEEIRPEDFTIARLITTGFRAPLIFRRSSPYGMRIPKKLTAKIIADIVGLDCHVEVIDCSVQEGVRMTLGKFVEYFANTETLSVTRANRHPRRERVYNLIDLEVSHTVLDDLIQAPALVSEVDWATNLWPQDLFAPPSKAARLKTQYPKTQKYILMSKAGSYTDFHIDFGGTSVWYHLVYGRKVFLLIPPSGKNHALYAQWVVSGQHLRFLGDEVDDCERIEVCEKDTIIIPSGWIHAVYTLENSLSIGGNFLHSLAGETQVNVARMEKVLKVKRSIRYPFFHDLLWFAARRYTKVLRRVPSSICGREKKTIIEILRTLQQDRESGASAICPVADERISDKGRILRKLQVIVDQLVTQPDTDGQGTFLWLSSAKKEVSVALENTLPKLPSIPRNSKKKDVAIPIDSITSERSVEKILTAERKVNRVQERHSRQSPVAINSSIPIHPVPLEVDNFPTSSHKGYIYLSGSVVPSEVSTYMQL